MLQKVKDVSVPIGAKFQLPNLLIHQYFYFYGSERSVHPNIHNSNTHTLKFCIDSRPCGHSTGARVSLITDNWNSISSRKHNAAYIIIAQLLIMCGRTCITYVHVCMYVYAVYCMHYYVDHVRTRERMCGGERVQYLGAVVLYLWLIFKEDRHTAGW